MNGSDREIPLKKDNSSKDSLFAPPSHYQRWVNKQRFPDQLSFGSKTVFCNVLPHPEQKEEWRLSSNLWNILSIPFETSIRVFEKERMLHLGPLIGIFTVGFTNNEHHPVGQRSNLFSSYLACAKDIGGYFFLFGSHRINWELGCIEGIFYKNNGWEKHSVPFPHVVYDRLPNRKTEQLASSKEVKARMQQHYLIPWFNAGFFNKWKIYNVLKSNESLKAMLPETILNPTTDDINRLLTEYRFVYLKPADGSFGMNVHQILKREDDPYYYCRFRDHHTNKLRRFTDLNQLINHQIGDEKLDTMIAQQGVDLIQIEKRPLDFRVHTNKDGKGEWKITAIAAKLSGQNSITTHLNSGGSVKTMNGLHFDNPAYKNRLDELPNIALFASKVIDENTEGFIGEIGFDIGIDKQGEIWLFEANSKPGRSIFNHPDLNEESILTRKLPLEYAVYLAKSSLEQPTLVLT